MLFDAENLFSDAQAVTGDAASTNVIDTGSANDVGPGCPVEIVAQVVEDFDNLTDLTIEIQTDSVENFATPTVLAKQTIALADLKIGKKMSIAHLPNGCEQYLRLNYDVNGTAPTTGKITAGIVAGVQTNG